MAKHTPTPWVYDGDDPPNQGFSVAFPGGGTLATAYYCDDGEGREVAEANARLIAAAPDLLEICQCLLRSISNGHLVYDKDVSGGAEQLRQLEAVVAKAEGNQP